MPEVRVHLGSAAVDAETRVGDSTVLASIVDRVDLLRAQAARQIDQARRSELGQFFTSASVARFMASWFDSMPSEVRLLDAGAGVGSLTAAFIEHACLAENKPRRIAVTAFEVDAHVRPYLDRTLEICRSACSTVGIELVVDVRAEDFLQATSRILEAGLFAPRERQAFNCAIMNPPYRKIHTASEARLLLRTFGVETSNLYTAFLAAATKLLEPGGQLVAITPRSFCNGTYFRSFRELFLREMALRKIHLFESRTRAFAGDDVLQENVIFHAVKGAPIGASIAITSNAGPNEDLVSIRNAAPEELVSPDDSEQFIRIVPDSDGQDVANQMAELPAALPDLGVEVSTGRVVDFRAREFLRADPLEDTVPLIYSICFSNGFIEWPPAGGKKPRAIALAPETRALLLPAGTYVLVKRLSAKEESRRIVAAIYDPSRVPSSSVAFENHINVYHDDNAGLPMSLAKGLTIFLNSTLVDTMFRQFSGHTQVNATDLRSLRYPARSLLESWGAGMGDQLPSKEEMDRLVNGETRTEMAASESQSRRARKKIDEALSVLEAIGLPKEQQNERSALTLLALLDLKPRTPWSQAAASLCGITPMMEFFAAHYGKAYAPNSRETVRRQTVHQFVDAALVVQNPDDPKRATNSGKNVYKVADAALDLLRTFGTEAWADNLRKYRALVPELQARYMQEREMTRILVTVAPGTTVLLSPGGQNVLVRRVIDEFCDRFAPGGYVIYVGDSEDKEAYFDRASLEALGVTIEPHGKMPDVVIHHRERNWLLLVEAVTGHGPVNPKRHGELKKLFSGSTAGLVFVTAFLDRKTMIKYLGEISWETEVWVAESPSHMIHFNGERFLGPYK